MAKLLIKKFLPRETAISGMALLIIGSDVLKIKHKPAHFIRSFSFSVVRRYVSILGGHSRESGRRKSPSGVYGQSPGRGFGNEIPQKLKLLCQH